MQRGKLSILPFKKELVTKEFGNSHPVEYLYGYLEDLKASALLVESHYVDRHYLDEFAQYYARSFNAPPATCGRVHFFSELGADELESLVASAYAGTAEREATEKRLQEHYLGFVVRRPLAGAPVGRTVLKTYPSEARRHYEVVRPYKVNVGGLQLEVLGLAYQQQDGGAAVCASTALWSALQRVAYVAGHRTPTPIAVTGAARSPFLASSGLSISQMAVALSNLGYVADYFAPKGNRALFRAKMASCLRSQLPVVLLLTRIRETVHGPMADAHAVTVTGFSEPTDVLEVTQVSSDDVSVRMRDASLGTIYVHDDNLGSHAHYELRDADDVTEDGHKRLIMLRGRSADPKPKHAWWTPDEWTVSGALVPKPAKPRLPVESHFAALFWIRVVLERKVFPGLDLDFAVYTAASVSYKRALWSYDLDRENVREFQANLTLPRHVGVIRVNASAQHLCDVLVDVSEIQRSLRKPSVLGIVAPGVPWLSAAHANLTAIVRYFDCPLITSPDTAA